MKYLHAFFALLIFATMAPAQTKLSQGGFDLVEKWTEEKDFRKRRKLLGLKSSDGSMALEFGTYTYVAAYAGTVFLVGKGYQKNQFILPQTYGLYDAAARREVQPATASFIVLYDGCVALMRDAAGNYAFLDLQGRDIAPQRYTSVTDRFVHPKPLTRDVNEPISRVQVPGKPFHKSGYVDACGREITPMQYQHTGRVSGGFATVKRDNKYTFIDVTGKEIIPPKYLYLTDFSEGVAAFTMQGEPGVDRFKGGSWGFINTRGEELGNARFEDIAYYWSFKLTAGTIGAKLNGQWVTVAPLAAAEEGGNPQVLSAQLERFRGGEGKPWGYRIHGGDVMLQPKWDLAYDFVDGRAVVATITQGERRKAPRKDPVYRYGLIDEKGATVVPLQYRSLETYPGGFYLVAEGPVEPESEWRYGLIDGQGNVVLPLVYGRMEPPSDGLIAVKKDGRMGFINLQGEVIIPPKYAYIGGFHQGLAPVSTDGQRWFWIDKNDQPVLSDKPYVRISHFVDGKATVWSRFDQWGRADGRLTIDRTGKVLETHPLNLPPPPEAVTCQKCGGTGSLFRMVEREYSVTNVDNFNPLLPGGKVVTTKSGTVTEAVRAGDCVHCQGRGKVMR